MRVTIVTETYYPQVNGVSRTLSQLVRVLQEQGDQVQLIHPDYHQPPERPDDLLVRSINPPFYPELYVPLPPFGKVKRAIDQFRPDIVHIATEATLGLAVLRHTRRRSAGRFQLSHQLRPVHHALPRELHPWQRLALPEVVSQRDPGNLRAVSDHDRRARGTWLQEPVALAARRR